MSVPHVSVQPFKIYRNRKSQLVNTHQLDLTVRTARIISDLPQDQERMQPNVSIYLSIAEICTFLIKATGYCVVKSLDSDHRRPPTNPDVPPVTPRFL